MNKLVTIIADGRHMTIAILSLIVLLLLFGVGIYLIFLLIKALKIYIKKNS